MGSIPDYLKEELERRLAEFEEHYEAKVMNKTDGVVPRIKTIDILIATTAGLVLSVYLLLALVLG